MTRHVILSIIAAPLRLQFHKGVGRWSLCPSEGRYHGDLRRVFSEQQNCVWFCNSATKL